MLKELKYLFFISIIFLFIFFNIKYYFSDDNKKKSYRSLKVIDKKITDFSQSLILLTNDTNNVTEYVKKKVNKNQKNYNFWKLINKNE
jgi:Zn-dependent protease with chaperone function